MNPQRMWPSKAAMLAVGALAAAVYANTLGNGFVVDDARAVLTNEAVHGMDVLRIFTEPSWLAPGGGYIAGTAHNIQADTAFEKIEALLAAYREFGADIS